jgi:hypothetical protein
MAIPAACGTAGIFVATDTLPMKGLGSLHEVLAFGLVAFAASRGTVPLFQGMVTVLAGKPVSVFGGVFLVVEQDVSCGVFQYDSEGLLRRVRGNGGIAQKANDEQQNGKAVGEELFPFGAHLIFPSTLSLPAR